MKKSVRNYVSKLALLSALVFSPHIKANLDFKMMKEVTRFLKKGKERYSLTLGKTALESGLIHNLRFYGNFEIKSDGKTQNRVWKNDHSNDPVWTLVKTLFPSTDGNLKAYAGAVKFTPENLGTVINFIDNLRNSVKAEKTGNIEQKSEVNKEILKNSQNRTKKNKNIDKLIEEFKKNKTSEEIELIESLSKIFKKNHNELLNLLEKFAGNLKGLTNFVKLFEDSLVGLEGRKYNEKIKLIPKFLEKYNGKLEYLTNFIEVFKDSLKQDNHKIDLLVKLPQVLSQAIEEEKGFYPQGTVEQIVLAFACEKLNTREDIYEFMKSLNKNIVSEDMPEEPPTRTTTSSESSDELTKKTLEAVSQKEEYTLDDVYALSHAKDFVTNLSPYPRGEQPGQNILTLVYSRNGKEGVQTVRFSDCIETAIRHVFNSILYMPKDKNFNLKSLEGLNPNNNNTTAGSDNPFLKDLIHFYKPDGNNIRDVKDAISSGSATHDDWNKVVGDLNAPDKGNSVKISYSESLNKTDMLGNGEYNMNPGFLNMVHVFQKILGFSLKDLDPNNPKGKEIWVTESLKEMFGKLNPDQKYKLEFDKGFTQHEQDIVGTLTVTTLEEEDKELVSFEIVMQPQHGYVGNIRNLHVSDTDEKVYLSKIPAYENMLKNHSKDLQSSIALGPVLESTWLLNLQNESIRKILIKENIHHPLYQLFDHKLGEVEANIQFIEHLADLLSQWKDNGNSEFLTDTLKQHVKKITGHVVSSLPEDPITEQKLMEAFRKIIKVKDWEKVFTVNRITSFSIKEENDINVLSHLRELKRLDVENNVEKLKFEKEMPNLEILDLSYIYNNPTLSNGIEGLNYLINLKKLIFGDISIKKLKFDKGMSKLETLDLSKTNIESIEGLFHLENLNTLIWSKKNDFEFQKDTMQKLKVLDLGYAELLPKNITNSLHNLTSLEEIKFGGDINGLRFKEKIPNLKKLDLEFVEIGKIEDIPENLETMKIGKGCKIEEIILTDKNKNLILDIIDSGITRNQIKGIEFSGDVIGLID